MKDKRLIAFFFSQVISQFGSALSGYAIVWYIIMESNSAIISTITTAANMIPGLLLTIPAGMLADRYSKKKIMILSDFAIAMFTFLFSIIGGLTKETIIFFIPLLALRSCFAGIQAPAANSFIAYLAKDETLEKYNALYQTFNTVSGFLAPVLGGVILSNFSLTFALYLDVFTAILGILILTFLVDDIAETKKINNTDTKTPFLEAYHYLRNNRLLFRLILFYGIVNFLFASVSFLSPLYIKRYIVDSYYMLTFSQLAWMIGTIAVSLVKFLSNSSSLNRNILYLAIATLVMGSSSQEIVFLGTMSIMGFSLTSLTVSTTSFIQTNVTKEFLGRVFSIFSLIATGGSQLGLFLFGIMGNQYGIRATFIISGVCLLIIYFVSLSKKISYEEKFK